MYLPRRTLTSHATLVATIALITMQGSIAQTPGFASLYSFQGGADGGPANGVTLGPNGALYGTTNTGGPNTCLGSGFFYYLCGTLFQLTPARGGEWTKTVIHNFHGGDGAAPGAGLVFGSNGVLYGTTLNGGVYDAPGDNFGGTIFQLTPPTAAGEPWTEMVLYSFSHTITPPNTPTGPLLVMSSGEIYATAFNDRITHGSTIDLGTILKLTPPAAQGGSWTENNLFDFYPVSSAGVGPETGIISAGQALYGTATFSTATADPAIFGGCGTVFESTPPATPGTGWTAAAIYTFGPPPDGCQPVAPLTKGPGGFYGTTSSGGTSGVGTVFQLTPPSEPGGPWAENVIYNLTGNNGNGDGLMPVGPIVVGKHGVLYGTTSFGGGPTSSAPCWNIPLQMHTNCGTVFALSPPTTPGGAWTETILHTFTGGDGEFPGPLVISPGGVLFGTTSSGGMANAGTVFAVKP